DGVLYSISIADDNLYSINKTTGLGTIIGPLGFNAVNSQDMEFDKITGVCYWLGNVSDYYSMNFFSVNTETGVATSLSNLSTQISTLAIPYTPSCLPLPVLSTPLNKSTCIALLPAFDWNDVDSANSYTFQLSVFPTFETIYFEQENLTLSEITLPIDYQLDEISRYYWRVKAIGTEECGRYWSSRFSFITEGDLQNPVLVSPPNLALNYIAKPMFVWNEIIGAANYDFHLSTNLDFSDTVVYQAGLTTTRYQSNGIELNTQYWWRVKTQNLCSQSEWSEPFTFTTSSNLVIGTGTSYNSQWDYPTAYATYSPNCKQQFLIRAEELNNAGGALGILTSISFQVAQLNFEFPLSDYTIKLKHTYSSSLSYWDLNNWTTVFGPVDYQPVAGWNTHNFDDVFVWDGVSNILVDICFYNPDFSGANIGTYYSYTSFVSSLVYYSYDAAINACSSPNYPNSYSIRPNMMFGINFTNLFPPQLQLPNNNSICVSTLPLLDWNDVQNATSYSIQLADNPNFEQPIVQLSGLNNSEYQLPNELILDENTEYYWRASASDGTTTSYWSLKYRFITEGDLSAPVPVFPTNGEINCSTSFLVKWNSDINSQTYHLQVATDDTLSNIIIDQANITGTEFSISGLNYNTQYWLRVSAQNSCSESPWSFTNIFTTGTHITIGTDNFVGKPNSYPAPYANNTEGAKHQIYILADELYNADIASSMFNSLSFNVAELASGNTLDNFTISMKHSNVKNLDNNWDLTGWQLVYGPVDYTPNAGWNTHTFDYPFNWDGVSNILIDICFNNEIGDVTENEIFYISSTSFNSTRYYNASGSDIVCTDPQWANLNSGRPNMRFDMDLSYFLAPKLISPAKSSLNVSLTPLFEWSNIELANSYSIQVSATSNFSTILFEHNNLTDNSYQVTDEEVLLGLTQYYWRVKASNNNYTSGWSAAWSFTTESGLDEQTISLNTGWNMISGYIVPSNPAITSIFTGMSKSLKLVKNGAGQIYDPAFRINTIGNWNQFDGYLVLMTSPSQINIIGEQIEPEETPLNLLSGWNLSAYFRDNDMSPATALASITTSLVLAKNNAGGIYMPSFGINTLGNMQAGQGYYFYMGAAAELTYPSNSAQKAVAGNNITPLAKFLIPSMNNTGKNSTLVISIENNDGNEIGIYNMNDELIGAGAVCNGLAAITIWGDDDYTQGVDGANENEYLHAKLFKTKNNTMTNIPLLNIRELTNNTEQNALFYETNTIYFAKSVSIDESVFGMSIKNIPNPVENDVVFEFGLTEESNAEIQIYTSTGELVASIGNKVYSAGIHRIEFDAGNLTSGVYNIVLSSGSNKVSSFMIVDK
nr:T9SS type A sorting domain-containing protein [Candidatus Kapabacteria bacterium]